MRGQAGTAVSDQRGFRDIVLVRYNPQWSASDQRRVDFVSVRMAANCTGSWHVGSSIRYNRALRILSVDAVNPPPWFRPGDVLRREAAGF